jgi:hypothetical protein
MLQQELCQYPKGHSAYSERMSAQTVDLNCMLLNPSSDISIATLTDLLKEQASCEKCE